MIDFSSLFNAINQNSSFFQNGSIDQRHPYALITEDDVEFAMDVDLLHLANSAPKGFGVLQLMTSSSSYVNSFWQKYKTKMSKESSKNVSNEIERNLYLEAINKNLWSRRKPDSPYWATQAYLINKNVVRAFIDKVVTYNSSSKSFAIKIINPSNELFPCFGNDMCSLPQRLVSDLYIFTGCGPTYLATVPMFNGASIGRNTTIHLRKNNDISHAKAFSEISITLADVRENRNLLPPFIRIKQCDKHLRV
jgi:hypothetical protein